MAGAQRKSTGSEKASETEVPAAAQFEYKILAHGSGGWIDQDRGEDQTKHKVLGTLLNECGADGWQVAGTYHTPTDHQPRVILMRPRP